MGESINLKILWLDDAKFQLDLFKLYLENLNHEVTAVSDADDAIEAVKNQDKNEYDVAFIDYNLSSDRYNGLDVGTQLKKIVPDLPIVILTADCTPEAEKAFRETTLEVDRFINKQTESNQIDDVLNAFISQKTKNQLSGI